MEDGTVLISFYFSDGRSWTFCVRGLLTVLVCMLESSKCVRLETVSSVKEVCSNLYNVSTEQRQMEIASNEAAVLFVLVSLLYIYIIIF